jgi:hypothetical protein
VAQAEAGIVKGVIDMVAVRIRRKSEDALFELTKLGPVRCLRDDIFLLTQKQFEALKGMKFRYEDVTPEEVEEKMKGVVLL